MQASRRQMLGLSFGAATALFQSPLALAARPVVPDPVRFRIELDGSDLGRYAVDFRAEGAELEARTHLELRYRIAYIPVWRYQHETVERWRGNSLVSVRGRTDANGRLREVSSEPDGEGLRVFGSRRRVSVVPPDTLTSNCQWHPEFVRQREIIDMNSGATMEIAAHPEPVDPIRRVKLGTAAEVARSFRVYLPRLDRFAFYLHYDARGHWVGGRGIGDGHRLAVEPL